MKTQIHALMLACVLVSAAPPIHAQKQDCTPPPPDSKMTSEQQKAAADGYRMACESAKSFRKRQAAESKSAAEVDEYIPDLYFPRMRPNPTLQDYMKWLNTEANSCPRLVNEARAGLATYPNDAAKLEFLKTIQTLVTEKRACE